MIDAADELDIGLIPIISAEASPSGKVTQEAFDYVVSRITSRLKRAEDLSGVCVALHGAGVAENHLSIEGELLRRMRHAAGAKVPISATLDLHGNITTSIIENTDAIFGTTTYPHVDKRERGAEAMRYLFEIMQGEAHPAATLRTVPILGAANKQFTGQNPAKALQEAARDWEEQPEVAEACIYYGFPYADVPHAGMSVVAITEADQTLAQSVAEDLACRIWERREEFRADLPKPPQAVCQALALSGQPVVISDVSDNPGAGGAADATNLLRAILEADLGERAAFAFICDREVVDAVHKAGVGSVLDLQIGAKTDDLHGESVSVRAYVRALTDGRYVIRGADHPGLRANMGRSACLVICPLGSSAKELQEGKGVDLVVTEERTFQVFDLEPFRIHGIDITRKKIVALKSAIHFRAIYEPISHAIIEAAGRGLTNPDISSSSFHHLRRPVFPLDADVRFSTVPAEGHSVVRRTPERLN